MPKNTDIIQGTHLWIFESWNIHGGDVNKIIAELKSRGIHGVIIKFANGSLNGDAVSQRYMAQFKKLVKPLKDAGIIVGGWIYQYLTDVQGEIDACTMAIEAGAQWIALDAELEIKGKGAQVTQFLQGYRAKHPDVVTALSSFPIAYYHDNEVPFAEYAKYVDFMMPQIYWNEMKWPMNVAYTAAIQSYKKYNKPIAPTGPTYKDAIPADIDKFINQCKRDGFNHISWWDWEEATNDQLNTLQANLMPRKIAPTYKELTVQINGKPFTNGIAVNDTTYLAWNALVELNVPHTYKGNGLMNINGVDVQGVVYKNDTYLPWNKLKAGIKAQPITGGFNFIVDVPVVVPTPAPVTPPQTQVQPQQTNTIANDVPDNFWNGNGAKAIKYVLDSGLMEKDKNNNFLPDNTITRAALAVVLERALNKGGK